MSKRTHYLPLSKVEAGMILADDLLDRVGHVLLPAGTTLSEHMLISLEHHGVHQISVIANDVSHQEEADEQHARVARLDQIFRQGPYNKPTSILKTYIDTYRHGEFK